MNFKIPTAAHADRPLAREQRSPAPSRGPRRINHGIHSCKHALCEHMPPEEHSRCAFYYEGSCRSVDAQIQALEKVKRAVSKAIKELKGEKDYE